MDPQQPAIYQIIVNGAIDPGWSDWLGALTLHSETLPGGRCQTVLTGPVTDQAVLRGILFKIWDLNLELVSIQQIRP